MTDDTPSLVAGRYRLDERIGSGPMGEVWRAYDSRADWTVAVKVLRARAATADLLRQHAQAVARVIHPNVAMVLDVGDHDGAPFLVMEFLTGESLGEEVAGRGPLPIREACDLLGQAAAGLEAAHRAGVVHGQIGPDSFRRAGSGVLKVVGFGLADQVSSDDGVRYRAPEVIDGRGGEAPADLYALACVLYETLCGRPPFDGTPEEVADQQLHADPTPPSRHRPEVSGELDRLVLALLAKDPAARPSSGESVRRALAAIARPPRPQTGQFTAPQTSQFSETQTGGATATQTGGAAGSGVGAGAGRGGGAGGDTSVMPSGAFHEGSPEPSSNQRLFVQLGVALAVIVAVTVGLVLWAGSRGGTPVAAPTPTPSVAPFTPSEDPTPTDESTPTLLIEPSVTPVPDDTETPNPKGTLLANSVPAGGWVKWLGEFDKSVTAQETMRDIDPGTAAKAHDKIRKAGRKFLEGHDDAGLNQIAGVMRDLRKAQQKGDVPSSGPLADFLEDWKI
jgi:serine/threonine protein kinase